MVEIMLAHILSLSKIIDKVVYELLNGKDDQPRTIWKKTVEFLKRDKSQGGQLDGLSALITRLSTAVENLWLYSDRTFSSLDGLPERDRKMRTRISGSSQHSSLKRELLNCMLFAVIRRGNVTWKWICSGLGCSKANQRNTTTIS